MGAGDVERIKIGGKEIILVGTAHISGDSVKLVQKTIKDEKPDSVGVELCESRFKTISEKQKWDETRLTTILRNGQAPLFLSNLLLSGFQRRLGKELGVRPGAEMIEGVKAAKKAKAEVVLLDRDITITLKRAWRAMGVIEKLKVFSSLFYGLFAGEEIDEEMVERLKEKDMITEMMEELSREAPSAKKVLIDERDIYIANKIAAAPGKKIVAVVGAGHVNGIKKHLRKKEDSSHLDKVPRGGRWMKTIGYLVPLVFLGIIAYGFYANASLDVAYSMVLWWFLINGALSALGAIIALGHPLTVLAAFIAAPFTSLNPTIGAGMVAGLVEAKVRMPRVRDFEALGEIASVSGFYRNRVSRILLVAALANLGSMIGTFVALPYIMSLI